MITALVCASTALLGVRATLVAREMHQQGMKEDGRERQVHEQPCRRSE
jgi:hypothetical protein